MPINPQHSQVTARLKTSCKRFPSFGFIIGIYLALVGIVISVLAVASPQLFVGAYAAGSIAALFISIFLVYAGYQLTEHIWIRLHRDTLLGLTQQIKLYLNERFLSEEPLTESEFWNHVYSSLADRSCKRYIERILRDLIRQGYLRVV